jgi:hypothetical protein
MLFNAFPPLADPLGIYIDKMDNYILYKTFFYFFNVNLKKFKLSIKMETYFIVSNSITITIELLTIK